MVFYAIVNFVYDAITALHVMLVAMWRVFFFNTRMLYSSETVMMATPVLFAMLIAWRIYGPNEQTESIAMQGYNKIEPHTLVDETTYAGGGNYTTRKNSSATSAADKKNN